MIKIVNKKHSNIDLYDSNRRAWLADKIKNALLKNGGEEDNATYAGKDLADTVLRFFGYEDNIIDNILEPEERDLFYMLEDYSILKTEREDAQLPDGRVWRIMYWQYNRNSKNTEKAEQDEFAKEENFYKEFFESDEYSPPEKTPAFLLD